MPRRTSDSRFDFIAEPDLYDFIWRIARKLTGSEVEADDVRQGATTIAMHLVLAGRGPLPGRERPWMCRVLKNHARAEWRKKKGAEPTLDPEDLEDYPAEDERLLNEKQQELEVGLHAMQEAMAKNPEHARNVMEADGRTEAVAAKDATARQRRARSRAFLASAISALVAAAVVFFVMRHPQPLPGPALSWTDPALATASRELALRRCGASAWEACLFGLEEAKRLDAAGDRDPRVQRARQQAVAGSRALAMSDCLAERWKPCLDGLDLARRYDPAGEEVPILKLARSQAERRVYGAKPDAENRAKQ
jgi:DNA-directed RNA polymerase specialized sigma24 family protein